MQRWIPKGWHYSLPFFIPLLSRNRDQHYRWKVSFPESMRYDIQDASQNELDIIKIVGFKWDWSDTQSARFGARYNHQREKLELFVYCHVDGVKVNINEGEKSLGLVEFGTDYYLDLDIARKTYNFTVFDERMFRIAQGEQHKEYLNPIFAWCSNFYFGGDKKSPKSMSLNISRVKLPRR